MKSKSFSGSFPSSSVHCAMSTAALLLVLSADLFQIGASQTGDCDGRCFSDYISGSRDCATLNFAIQCYYTNIDHCGDFAHDQISAAELDHEILGCPSPSTEAPSTTAATESETVPPPPACPRIPPFVFGTDSAPALIPANITPTLERQDCIEYDPQDLQHCSMFGFSSLRPFQAYHNGLEACNTPGSWFLLRHRTVTVEVEGVAVGDNLDHTKLSKINVTFYPSGNCLAETKSYVALADSTLSQNFTDQTQPNTNTCGSRLQMNIDPDDTVVTLLATWINTTIVIRRHADLLAITLQVPGHLAFESDGLCRGCPAHTYVNVTHFLDRILYSNCIDESNYATFHCFFSFANIEEFSDIINITYSDTCKYSLWRGNSSNFDVLSLLIAVSEDAKLLPSYGNIPPRRFDIVEPGDSDGAVVINDSCNPPGNSNDTTDPIDTTDRITSTTTKDRTITTQRLSTEQPATTTTDAGLSAEEISSAIHGHQRQAVLSLLATAILSVLLSRLLFR